MNYKDLQNIAFLSQEILTESATQDHDALDRWPYTSPYLQESTEVSEERSPGVKPYCGGKEVGDKMRAGYGIKITAKPLSGKTGDASGYGAPEKFKKPDDNIEMPGTTVPAPKKGGYGRISPVIPYGIGANSTKSRSANSRVRRLDPGAPTSQKLPPEDKKKLSREIVRKPKNEEYDLYDVILSHLLDEGYAETVESAEAIMVNMSEDWRESIVEEQKPLPRLRMAGQTLKKLRRGFEGARNAINSGETKDTSGGQIAAQKSMKDVTQAQNMFNTLLGHSKEKAKAKETSNRAIGRVAQEDPASAAVFRKYKK